MDYQGWSVQIQNLSQKLNMLIIGNGIFADHVRKLVLKTAKKN